jgi:hypothetical protein
MAEFITEANLNSLFTKTAPTKADTISNYQIFLKFLTYSGISRNCSGK